MPPGRSRARTIAWLHRGGHSLRRPGRQPDFRAGHRRARWRGARCRRVRVVGRQFGAGAVVRGRRPSRRRTGGRRQHRDRTAAPWLARHLAPRLSGAGGRAPALALRRARPGAAAGALPRHAAGALRRRAGTALPADCAPPSDTPHRAAAPAPASPPMPAATASRACAAPAGSPRSPCIAPASLPQRRKRSAAAFSQRACAAQSRTQPRCASQAMMFMPRCVAGAGAGGAFPRLSPFCNNRDCSVASTRRKIE